MATIGLSETASGAALLTLDDGNLNTFDADLFSELSHALDECSDAPAVVITGRPGVFTAGLDLKAVSRLRSVDLHHMLVLFGQTMIKVWLQPRPVVAAATGHAIAAGTMLAMATDHAVAARGDYRWGLTETRIGFGLPEFGLTLARANVRSDRYDDLLLRGQVIGPDEAVDVGFADELADAGDVVDIAVRRAAELAELPPAAYAAQKQRLRGAAAQRVLDTLGDDIAGLLPG